MKKEITPILLAAASTLTALAQAPQARPDALTTVNGKLLLMGGLGPTDRLSGRLDLDIAHGRFHIKPYIGFADRKDTDREDLYFHYVTQKDYTSASTIDTKSQRLIYGFNGFFQFDELTRLTFSLDGKHHTMNGDIDRSEELSPIDVIGAHKLKSQTDIAHQDLNDITANLSLRHTLSNAPHSFGIDYTFSRIGLDDLSTIKALSGSSVFQFQQNRLDLSTTTLTHTVKADFRCIVGAGQSLTFAGRYNQRSISVEQSQRIDGQSYGDPTFDHDMTEVAASVEYTLRRQAFNVNARLEYLNTQLKSQDIDKTLHDAVPSLRAQWIINPSQDLTLTYGMRIIRPNAALLNPFEIHGAFTTDYGNPALKATHANSVILAHSYKTPSLRLSTSLQHIFANDGFNAIWMVKDNMRVSTWGNEGIRRAWGLTPDAEWHPTSLTTLQARATLLWDKRIAEAINMTKEHWGITTHIGIRQQLLSMLGIHVFHDYSEGNTIDLYSHSGKQMSIGGELSWRIMPSMNLHLAYVNVIDHPVTILTQGMYTGTIFRRPTHDVLSLCFEWAF